MAQTKRIYRIQALTLQEVNRVLMEIGNRLDEIEGYRGSPTFRSAVEFTAEAKYTDENGTVLHSFGGT